MILETQEHVYLLRSSGSETNTFQLYMPIEQFPLKPDYTRIPFLRIEYPSILGWDKAKSATVNRLKQKLWS